MSNEISSKADIISRISDLIKPSKSETVKAGGDDAAEIKTSGNTLIATDILTEGIHFDLIYTPLKHLGYKTVVAGLSEIVAMNAIPLQVMISIAVSAAIKQNMLDEFFEGVKAACNTYNVDLLVGDITSSKTGFTICVTAIGESDNQSPVYRSGAKPTDLICVTGNLGAAYAGLQLLEREKTVFLANPEGKQPELTNYEYILRRQLKPELQTELKKYLLTKQVVPTSMIDITSGLAGDITSLCNASAVGCEIFEERIPINPETKQMSAEFNIDPTIMALNGGEDFELLFTIDLKNYKKIKDNDFFSIIGSINSADKGMNIVTRSGAIIPLQNQE